jgi:hypothetical protein
MKELKKNSSHRLVTLSTGAKGNAQELKGLNPTIPLPKNWSDRAAKEEQKNIS